jgi:hypothetical protein
MGYEKNGATAMRHNPVCFVKTAAKIVVFFILQNTCCAKIAFLGVEYPEDGP